MHYARVPLFQSLMSAVCRLMHRNPTIINEAHIVAGDVLALTGASSSQHQRPFSPQLIPTSAPSSRPRHCHRSSCASRHPSCLLESLFAFSPPPLGCSLWQRPRNIDRALQHPRRLCVPHTLRVRQRARTSAPPPSFPSIPTRANRFSNMNHCLHQSFHLTNCFFSLGTRSSP